MFQTQMKYLADIARSWIGVKYCHKGFTRSGCDCIGLLYGVLIEAGVFEYPVQIFDYAPDWMIGGDKQELLLKYVPLYTVPCDLMEGCFLLFRMGKYVCHVGIYIGNDEFVHSVGTLGVKKDFLSDRRFRDRLYSIVRLKDEYLEKIKVK